eukprot:CAMPEP_0197186720 /NCGR_PEP_ID=MMETSP1423-20130617/14456_1 /TAXON_ID=476441 /ORGANISM="Pseudo-nitzschia heimii, Strain UNC1101" /LENGTH=180 /DNA_ID=CAMNT_0042638111 /DNA_START=97 /DNA_END=639 /DNA_ORIENTATION=-
MCNRKGLLALHLLSIVWTSLNIVTGFTVGPAIIQSSTIPTTSTILSSKNADGECQNEEEDTNTGEDEKGEFNWLEEWALEGKDAVSLMKTEERTKRVMLAQMTEDRIYEITKLLDTMVDEATGEIAEGNIPKAKELAMQTRNLQKEYKDLVTGAPSTMLQTLSNLKLPEDDGNKTDGDKK